MLYKIEKEQLVNEINKLADIIIKLQDTYDNTVYKLELTENTWGGRRDKEDKEYLNDIITDMNNYKVKLNELLKTLLTD